MTDWKKVITRMDKVLSLYFHKLGGCVARWPAVFFVVPLILTGLLALVCIYRMEFVSDIDYLYVPTDSQSREERETIELLFPANVSRYVLGTETRLPSVVDLILTSTNTSHPSILSRSIWEEAAQLVRVIEELKVVTNQLEFGWKEICASFMGKCIDNNHLSLVNRLTNLTYPLTKEGDETYQLVAYLGGVQLDNGTVIQEAYALRLNFPMEEMRLGKQATKLWGSAVRDLVSNVRIKNVRICSFVADGLENDGELNIYGVMEVLPITILLLATFTVFNSMCDDWIRSKPMVGFMGLLNVGMACISGFGVAVSMGYKWQCINLISVFLLLGVGLDGVFLMLSSWTRSESRGCNFITRLSNTYSDVSVSITISSFTNMISFFVGTMVPGCPCVHIFCAFTGFGILFTYIWTLTMFGAVLAWAGWLEDNNRHCIFMYTVMNKEKELEGFTDHPLKERMKDKEENSSNVTFFGNVLSPILSNSWSQVGIFLVFGCYLCVSLWGLTELHQGLEKHKLVRDDSPSKAWFRMDNTFFKEHPIRIQIVVSEPVDYHNETTQNQLLNLIDKFESSQFVSNSSQYRQSWLHEYLSVAKENFIFFNISTKEQFVSGVHRFLDIKEVSKTPIKNDVLFNKDGSKIVSSRFFLLSGKIENAEEEVEFQRQMRDIASSAPFPVISYSIDYPFMDQFTSVLPTTLECIVILCLIMTFITILLIPNRTSVIWVIFTILSTQIGVGGFMSLWNINLDVISMIVIIMSIGFSVDFSAHISYHYLSADASLSPRVKLTHTLDALGPPILQGALTSLIGTIPFFFQPSYVLCTFSKMMFLVITLGLAHSLLLLPILLVLLGPGLEEEQNNDIGSKWFSSSPAMVSLSHTFVFNNHNGEVKVAEEVISPTDKIIRRGLILRQRDLNLSLFKPNDSVYSGSSSFSVVKDSEEDLCMRTRSQSDSGFYDCQTRPLSRDGKNVGYWARNRKGPEDLTSRPNIPVHIRNIQESRPPQSPLAAGFTRTPNYSYNFTVNENNVVGGEDNPGFKLDETYTSSAPRGMNIFELKKKLEVIENNKKQEKSKSVKLIFVDHQHQDTAILPSCLENESFSDDKLNFGAHESFQDIELEN